MASEKKVINQEDFANNKTETNPKGAKTTEAVISNGNPIGDRLWLEHFANEHFANALHKTVFNDDEYRKLLRLIDRELARKYKGKI